MLLLHCITIAITLVTSHGPDSTTAVSIAVADSDTTLHAAVSRDTSNPPHQERPKAIEYSDWYARRLAIHKWASYTTLPLFAAQYITGNQLLKYGRYSSPARYIHGPVATALAGLFAVNTVTGVWNLKESWPDPEGRTRRTLHSTLMLIADAGFVVAGELAKPGLNSSLKRQQHKQVAMVSMGISLVSYFMMLPPFRGD
jgi:hypothetical protein